jgi:uncharacterized repeat protein (TIGR03803 family)
LVSGLGSEGLTTDAEGDLLGTGLGSVFEITKTPTGYASTATVLASFNGFDGNGSEGSLLADAEGDLFAISGGGGPGGLYVGEGTVFEIVKTPTGYSDTPGTVVYFTGVNGSSPTGSLIADSNGDLFGTTEQGGANFELNDGTVFEITRTGDSSTLVSFNGADGLGPGGNLLLDGNGDLFGTTAAGGAHDGGTVFEIKKTAAGYANAPTTLASFAEDSVADGLIADANGDLFGTTSGGGSGGTVFEIKKTATGYASTPTTLASFNPLPLSVGGLIMDGNGDLFGVTDGTLLNPGTVFEIKKTASGYASAPTTLVSFNPLDGPRGGLIADADGDLFGANDDGAVFEITDSGFVPGGPAKPPPPSIGDLIPKNPLTTLVSFTTDFGDPSGEDPSPDLIADSAGDLFGTAGGGSGTPANPAQGIVFEIKKTAAGYASSPTPLVTFTFGSFAPSGPRGGLLADSSGDLFGTTEFGGPSNAGTVFEIVKTGGGYASTPAILADVGSDAGLLADANGDLFGTSSRGGTVFEIVKTGGGYASTPAILADVGSDASLIADANGDLFGTTELGGLGGAGTVFEIKKTATGYADTPTTLASFDGGDGSVPKGSLIADSRGDLFFTTSGGGGSAEYGAPDGGAVFEIVKTATGYASTPILLASFHGLAGGFGPEGGLIMDANGDLFGTTSGVDPSDPTIPPTPGTVFEIEKTAAGYASTPTTLVAFDDADGAAPLGTLIADATGHLFGTTSAGGASNGGTVFEITDSGFATTPTPPPTVTADILWQNASTGQASVWEWTGARGSAAGRSPSIRGRRGARSERAISMMTAMPTSCGRTRRPAKPRSGRWTGTPAPAAGW